MIDHSLTLSNDYNIVINNDKYKTINDKIKNIILYEKNNKLYNNNYGVDLLRYLFEPTNKTFEKLNDLKQIISNEISKYIPEIIVQDIQIDKEEDNLSIIYKLKKEQLNNKYIGIRIKLK